MTRTEWQIERLNRWLDRHQGTLMVALLFGVALLVGVQTVRWVLEKVVAW